MKKLFLLCLLSAGLFYVASCNLNSKAPAAGWTVEVQPYVKRYCVNNEHCADVNIQLPLYRGEQSATLGAFNEAIQRHLLTLVDAPTNQSIDATLDSVAASFFNTFANFKLYQTTNYEPWQMKLTTTVPVLTPQITTVEARQFLNIFLNQKSELFHVVTYDFRTEKYLNISDLITDTVAFRPMLETAFFRERQLNSADEITQMLLQPMTQLPMPHYAAVYPDGIRIVYNAQEYSHLLDIPITDFKFSWEQLGTLADKTKWLE